MRYRVIAGVAVVRSENTVKYIYEGGYLPGDVPAETVEHLVTNNIITAEDGPVAEVESVETPTAPPSELPADAPSRSASKEAWVGYMVGKGWSQAEADKLKRDELIAEAVKAHQAGQAV